MTHDKTTGLDPNVLGASTRAALSQSPQGDTARKVDAQTDRPADYKHKDHLYTAGQDFIWLRNKIWEGESKGIFLSNHLWMTECLFNLSKALQINHIDEQERTREPAPASDDGVK